MFAASSFFAAMLVTGTLAQYNPAMRGLGAMTNESAPIMFMADEDTSFPPECTWPSTTCVLDAAVNDLAMGSEFCSPAVPIPVDNYVDDDRTNKDDTDETRTHTYVKLKSTFLETNDVDTKTNTWKYYKNNRATVQSGIHFNAPGLYTVEIDAKDYDREATCSGCVAVRDTFRPRFGSTGSCPVLTDATLTQANFDSFVTTETAFNTHTADNNIVNNNVLEELCESAATTTRGNFYDTAEVAESCCFDNTILTANVAALKTDPLTGDDLTALDNDLEDALNDQCQWCCTKSRTLSESYIAYQCPTTASPNQPGETCETDNAVANTCGIEGCLTAIGTDIVQKPTALASIKSTVKTKSDSVLAALPEPKPTVDTTKAVLRSVSCTSYDPDNTDCTYTAKLSDLLDYTALAKKADFPSAGVDDIKNFVFYRYNIDGGVWKKLLLTGDEDITFDDASSTVTIQAWTACGHLDTYSFDVNLYLHSSLTCTGFDTIWLPEGTATDSTYCAHSQSDFGLVKVDLSTAAVASILPSIAGRVSGSFAGMSCSIKVKDAALENPTITPKDAFLTMAATGTEYFAVELVNTPNTARKTSAEITCTFTRTPRSNGDALLADADDAHSVTCSPHTIVFTDCDGPELDETDTCYGDCGGAAGHGETCAGRVVTSSGSTTSTTTLKTTQACCTATGCSLECAAAVYDGVASTVQYCQPDNGGLMMELAAEDEKDISSMTTTMALLGASAMVAVVALVAVKRRTAAVQTEEDAYYPLLE